MAGIGAPKNTPAAVVETLNGEINAVLADPALNTRLLEMGVEPDPMSVTKSARFIAADATDGRRWSSSRISSRNNLARSAPGL